MAVTSYGKKRERKKENQRHDASMRALPVKVHEASVVPLALTLRTVYAKR